MPVVQSPCQLGGLNGGSRRETLRRRLQEKQNLLEGMQSRCSAVRDTTGRISLRSLDKANDVRQYVPVLRGDAS